MGQKIKMVGRSFLISLGPLIVVFLPFFLMRPWIWQSYVPRMYMGIGCGCLWLGLSPLLIRKYKAASSNFFDAYEKSGTTAEDVCDFREDFQKNFLKDRFFVSFYLFWSVLVEIAILSDITYLERFGIRGWTDPYLYLFCICMLYVLVLTAAGFAGIFYTIKLVYILLREKHLQLEYLDADGVGGLGYVADYIYETSKLFATGVLFVPIVLDYIYYTQYELVRGILYLIILLYGAAVVLIYLIPLKALYRYASDRKQEYLEALRKQYYLLMQLLLEKGRDNTSEDELMAINVYHYIVMVEQSSSFHIEHQVLSQVLQLVILPVISLLINLNDIISLVQSFWFW